MSRWLLKSLLLLLFPSSLFAATKTVCTATINSADEKAVFQKMLSPQEFKFVELTSFAKNKEDSEGWFQAACEAQVQCDVLIVSGHFGGSFFGSSKFSLGLPRLETNSCQNRCAGILQKPKEVYLFGCNTLASKDKDRRTPEQYLEALMEHDMSRTEAERIVAARYSPIGFSYRDRMERIFEGVPLIYGFSSIAPAGANVRDYLKKYLTEIGDYGKHLERIDQGVRDTRIFSKNLAETHWAVASGVVKEKTDVYAVKENTCKMSDEQSSLADRVDLAKNLLDRDPYLYFPAVANLISQYSSYNAFEQNVGRNVFEKFTLDKNLRVKLSQIGERGGFGLSMQIDLLKLARNVAWLSESEYRAQIKKLLLPVIKNPTVANKDSMCALRNEGDVLFEIRYSDLDPEKNFQSSTALSLLSCLTTKDDQIAKQYIAAAKRLLKNSNLSIQDRGLVLIGLLSLPGSKTDRLEVIRQQPATLAGPYAKEYVIFVKQMSIALASGDEQFALYRQYMDENKGNKEAMVSLSYFISLAKDVSAKVEVALLERSYKSCGQEDCGVTYGLSFTSIESQDWLSRNLLSISEQNRNTVIFYLIRNQQQIQSKQLLNFFTNNFERFSNDGSGGQLATILANQSLSLENLATLRLQLKSGGERAKPNIRYVLATHKDKIPDLQLSEISGKKVFYKCMSVGSGLTCQDSLIEESPAR